MSKILINILSEQSMPNYLAIRELQPDKVIALTSKEYVYQVNIFKKLTQVEHLILKVDPYNLQQNQTLLKALLEEIKDDGEIVINYTGGTKVLVVSVILEVLLSSSQQLTLAYVNSKDNLLEFLNIDENKKTSSSHKEISTSVPLAVYVQLKNEKLLNTPNLIPSYTAERFELSSALLQDLELSGIFNNQKQYFETTGKGLIPKLVYEVTTPKYKLRWNKSEMEVSTRLKQYRYPHSDGGKYFAGIWLEEYVFCKLRQSNYFDELLYSVKFDYTSGVQKMKNWQVFKNEIDVVVGRGTKTLFIECKAGNATQDHVYKLKTLRDHYLGTFGQAILVTRFKPGQHIIEKCNDANILPVFGEDVQNIDHIVNGLI